MNETYNKIGAFAAMAMLCTFTMVGLFWCLHKFTSWFLKFSTKLRENKSAGGWNAVKMWTIPNYARARIIELQVLIQQLNMSLSQKERSYECLLALQGATEKRLSEAEGALAAQVKKIKYAEEQNKALTDKLLRAGNAEWGMTEIKRRDEEIDKLARAISELQRIKVDSTRVLGIKIMRIGVLEDQLRQVVATAERIDKAITTEDAQKGCEEMRQGIKHIKTLL